MTCYNEPKILYVYIYNDKFKYIHTTTYTYILHICNARAAGKSCPQSVTENGGKDDHVLTCDIHTSHITKRIEAIYTAIGVGESRPHWWLAYLKLRVRA